MIKNFFTYLKESYDYQQEIIFEDLKNNMFDGNYKDMLSFLNSHLRKKRVFFISENNIHYNNQDQGWIVKEYLRIPPGVQTLVYVEMTNNQGGNAKGLVYLEPIGITVGKKYKKIGNPIVDPYGEEDWGWEEIMSESLEEFVEYEIPSFYYKYEGDEPDSVILDINRLVRKIRDQVLGKTVEFLDINKQRKKFKVNRVSRYIETESYSDYDEDDEDEYNYEKISCLHIYFSDENNQRHEIIENQKIKILFERVFTEDDPYGEESWGDLGILNIHENLKEDE